jgi:hypothetical protein
MPYAKDDALISERLLDRAAVSLADPLIELPTNWIMGLLLMAAEKLNSPTHPTCHPVSPHISLS